MVESLKEGASSVLGLTDVTQNSSIWRSLLAEFIGTLLLVCIGCGAVVTLNPLSTDEKLPPGFVVQIALAFGLIIGTVVQSIAHVSGGHVNPAVTISMFVTGDVKLIKAVLYIIVQLLGGICGAAILKLMVPADRVGALGMTAISPEITPVQGLLVEVVGTFILVLVVHSVCDSKRQDLKGSAPLAIGLCITAVHMFAVQFTGSSLNPARTFGPSVVMSGWTYHWVYWVGPILGGVLAAVIYKVVLRERREGDSYDF